LLDPPQTDPAAIFEHFRGAYATELLVVAVTDFNIFGRLNLQAMSLDELRHDIGLAERPANVLVTALRAMGLLDRSADGLLDPTPIAREHLIPGSPFDVSGYVALASDSPCVRAMAERLRTNRPAGYVADEDRAAFIFREGLESAMDREESARRLTLSLAGRAMNVAPHLAANVSLDDAKVLLDVGGGSGIYAIACLQRYHRLRAIIWDRAEVLKVADEMAEKHGVKNRVDLVAGDMFADAVPAADVVLLSNILHDWAVPECRSLLKRCADALPSCGRLLIHDVFLDDDHGGPLPIALYSAALFSVTEGRAYSAAEYRGWLREAGLSPSENVIRTLVQCGVLVGCKQ
jgi:SAM-dependent methyltransferase